MNTDLLTSGAGDPATMRKAAYRVISKTQDDPAVQVQAIALALVAVCDALSIDIRQLLVSTERMTSDLSGPFTSTFDAMREYARAEIGAS